MSIRNLIKHGEYMPIIQPGKPVLRDIFGSDDPAPAAPNYQPLADSSREAAALGKQLGEAQIAEARRQYDNNMAVSKPVIDAQLGLMRQQQQQGDEYYGYMKDTFRPLEQRMVSDANYESSAARAEEAAAQAMADARVGQTQQANQMVRQGLRYGWSPAKLAAMAGNMAGANASALAGAATGARANQRNIGWARSMDAAGLGRNLPGASMGAYGLSMNAGNSAVGNAMTPSNALMAGMAQGAGMQQTGMGQQLSGLGNVLSSQTSAFNAGMSQAPSSNGFGSLLGMAAGGIGAGMGGPLGGMLGKKLGGMFG